MLRFAQDSRTGHDGPKYFAMVNVLNVNLRKGVSRITRRRTKLEVIKSFEGKFETRNVKS